MTVDPKVYALADGFVFDLLSELPFSHPMRTTPERERLAQRAAEAMQQAIEQECDAIRKELQG